MDKKKIYKIMFAISIIFIILYFIRLLVDYNNYNPLFTSAPFYTYIIIRSLEFLLPTIIFLIIGLFLKKKDDK